MFQSHQHQTKFHWSSLYWGEDSAMFSWSINHLNTWELALTWNQIEPDCTFAFNNAKNSGSVHLLQSAENAVSWSWSLNVCCEGHNASVKVWQHILQLMPNVMPPLWPLDEKPFNHGGAPYNITHINLGGGVAGWSMSLTQCMSHPSISQLTAGCEEGESDVRLAHEQG